MSFSETDLERYARHIVLREVGGTGQAKIRAAKVLVVDGNVMRVLSRLTGFDGDIAEPTSAAFFWKVAGEVPGAGS